LNIHGDLIRVGHAANGMFTASVFQGDSVLVRITPGVRLSEHQLLVWFAEFPTLILDVDTDSVSLYKEREPVGWPVQQLRERIQDRLEDLVAYLHGVQTGTLFP